MIFHRTIKKEFNAEYIDIDIAVRYDEEDMPNDAPLRDGNSWKAVINLTNKCICNWPKGKTLSFHDMKICDEGIYILRDIENNEITRITGYVPNALLPGDYGDYLSLDIDENGFITNWKADASLEDFEGDNK
jgi:hypothetical protein